ncbi:intraflagellar transport protein 56-like [Solea solea]|uniref:intraflagellar transport protein 56-like n=1 Tax=Solea solea TaxID=90069 RepID=UPI00272C5D26|nr:intraflagellar transport protein 56-like [Solea solea]
MIHFGVKPLFGGETVRSIQKKNQTKVPHLKDYLQHRDFLGALTLLEFQRSIGENVKHADLWIGYCAFHLGDFKRAMEEYQSLTRDPECPAEVWAYLACSLFFLGLYKEAEEAACKAPVSPLQNRLLLHLAHKFNAEKNLMEFHKNLKDTIEDNLSLASINYMHSHYNEAIDIYRQLALQNGDSPALNMYVALCYYRLGYYDRSLEVLNMYLQSIPDSTIAINLKACNHFRLDKSRAAEAELKNLINSSSCSFQFAKELIQHNLVVFCGGAGALQMLPPLINVIPEARLNLVIYHLRQDNSQEAYNLIKDLVPTTPQEYTLKGVVNVTWGRENGSRDHLKIAQQFFQLVGGLVTECDTVPGRQCLASCFFLLRQFEDVLVYLNSIKRYLYYDDTFNFNYAQAKAALGYYKEAEVIFQLVQSDKIKNDYIYLSWLARCYIMNQKGQLAWELYLKMRTSSYSFSFLQLIASDCYTMGQFYYAAKAFDALEKLQPESNYYEGKRGACVGVFQLILANKEPKETLKEVVHLLQNSGNPQVEYIIRTLRKWAKDNGVILS